MKNLPKVMLMGLSLTLFAYSCKKEMQVSSNQVDGLATKTLSREELANIHMCNQLFLPDNPRAALQTAAKWKNGTEITVKMIGGSDTVRANVMKYSHKWSEYANITFKYVTEGDADVRITFQEGKGSYSQLGTNALKIAQDKETMNYGWFTDKTSQEEFSRTVLHEFGHALGLNHEQQHPDAYIPWDRDKVYTYYENMGWTKASVDAFVLNPLDSAKLDYSAYDRKSIMHYSVPKELLTDSTYALGYNRVLSATDKSFIAKMYPKE